MTTNLLKSYFPMIQSREEILARIYSNPKLQQLFESWTVLQQKDAFLNPGKNVRAAACFRIATRAVLDVHRHIVKNAVTKKNLQHSGIGAVGVQLDGEAQGLDLLQKSFQPGAEQGLSAGDADALEDPLSFLQVGQHFLF